MSGAAYATVREALEAELEAMRAQGTFRRERVIHSPQSAHILAGAVGGAVVPTLNFCSNDYLGLADDSRLIAAATRAMEHRGFGLASVRFICGTQDLHVDLERAVSAFLGTEDTILFSSCFDANGGVFEALFGPEDAIVSDALNHASIIDGIRLSKAARFRYRNGDMADLRAQLEQTSTARRRVIVTDGVFSMDGAVAPLREICDLADEFGALVMVDDSHAVGAVGPGGRGTPALAEVDDRVDIFTGTFGKALGGASGGYVSGRAAIVAMLRQRARPYLFSNTIPPAVAAAAREALAIAGAAGDRRDRLRENAARFRSAMTEAGFDLLPGAHPIVPVMFGDANLAVAMADRMLARGVYVTAFSYPVVPLGQARIRVQLSAAHSDEDIDRCVEAFVASRADLA
ncbi:glycine C-acetyltransferase [Leifsonia soli]|uniref:2-amino-3-ketobutyrate coenzyme A ligase n=1 Tax=Leifsonia soli TaxID=582665 RepID=A0A852T5F6_9MICO|nr:glycine C-acetyltransferase [Leifsonia soli]